MGGNKSYPSRKLIGNSKSVNDSVKKLTDYLEKEDSKKVAKTAFEVFTEAKKTVEFSAYSNKLTPFIIRNFSELKSEKNIEVLKRKLSGAWSDVKTKNKIEVPKQLDRLVVENAIKSLRGEDNE